MAQPTHRPIKACYKTRICRQNGKSTSTPYIVICAIRSMYHATVPRMAYSLSIIRQLSLKLFQTDINSKTGYDATAVCCCLYLVRTKYAINVKLKVSSSLLPFASYIKSKIFQVYSGPPRTSIPFNTIRPQFGPKSESFD